MLKMIHRELGINDEHLNANKLNLSLQPPLDDLEVVDIDYDGKPFLLRRDAAQAWREMTNQANADHICLMPFSGFRSYLHQRQLIRRKLEKGLPLEVILTETAIPGFSEHHSGQAVDICADGKFYLTEDFETTEAFLWLGENAARFGFQLSYPRSNDKGIIYEPWHWCFNAKL